jgi:hypothetical protein
METGLWTIFMMINVAAVTLVRDLRNAQFLDLFLDTVVKASFNASPDQSINSKTNSSKI